MPLKKPTLSFIIALCFSVIFYSSVYSSDDVVYAPNAQLGPVGALSVGTSRYSNYGDKAISDSDIFFKYSLTERFQYQLKVMYSQQINEEFAIQGFRWSPLPSSQIAPGHIKWIIGYQYLGKDINPSMLVIPFYDAYTVLEGDLDFGSLYYSVGLGRNRANENKGNIFCGIGQRFLFGDVNAEWDGKTANFGMRIRLAQDYLLSLAWTPNMGREYDKQRQFSFSFTFQENLLESFLGHRIRKEFSKTLVPQDDPTDYLDRKFDHESKVLYHAALKNMAQGNKAYYNKEYELAERYYKRVVSAVPSFTKAQIRLGTIYYMQKEHEQAIKHWKEAVALDPTEVALKKSIADIESQFLIQREE